MGVFSLREGTGKTDFEKRGGGRNAGAAAAGPRPTDEAADYFESFKCLSLLLLLLLRFLIHICRGRGRARPAPAAAAPHSAQKPGGEYGEDFDEDSF